MHPALQIPELLYAIFSELTASRLARGADIFACCVTCRTFSEVALDLIWSSLPTIAVMPFSPFLEYREDLDANSARFDEITYLGHLERLKFYGRRVHALQVNDKFTPELLRCVQQLRSDSPSIPSPSPMSTIFPKLRNVNFVLPVNGPNKNLLAHIHTFLLPTIRDLSLYTGANTSYDNPTEILRAINNIQPSLTSLTLGSEIISGLSKSLLADVKTELTSLISSLPHLEKLEIPTSLLVHPVLPSVASIPALRHLKLSYPVRALWKRFATLETCAPPLDLTSTKNGSFPSLESLVITSTIDSIPRILMMHEHLGSRIFSLSICTLVPFPSSKMLTPFDPHNLSSNALQFLTHLSFDFGLPFPSNVDYDLDRKFLTPLLSASFISRLVSFHIRHRQPPIVNDLQFEAMARAMSNLESIRFVVKSASFLRQTKTLIQQRIHASLATLLSFANHCPKLQDITLPLNAEEFPVPTLPPRLESPFTHPVYVDLSVSLVRGKVLLDTAKFLAAVFPHRSCHFISYWEGADNQSDEGDAYAERWKTIFELIQDQR